MSNWEFDQIVSNATKLQEKIKGLEAEVIKLKTPFEAMKKPHNISFSYYSSEIGTVGYLNKIKLNYEAALVLATENDAINTHNKTVVDKLRKTIIATGFSDARSEYKRSKRVSVPSEWTKDIVAELGVGSAEIERRYQEFLKAVELHTFKEEALKKEKVRMEEAALEEKKKEIAFVDLCRDLKLDPLTTSNDEVLEHLLAQCKYLDLAHAGQATRNDWSVGPWRVRNAVNRFNSESAEDEDIIEEYLGILDEFEDGRSFRYCKYNYDKLFSMVDPTLLGLYERLMGSSPMAEWE